MTPTKKAAAEAQHQPFACKLGLQKGLCADISIHQYLEMAYPSVPSEVPRPVA